MRLKLDENIDARLAGLLQASGHDALTVREQNLHGTDDVDLYHICSSENRALVTLDLDFFQHPPISAGKYSRDHRSARSG